MMKKTGRKILGILLALMLTAGLFPAAVRAEAAAEAEPAAAEEVLQEEADAAAAEEVLQEDTEAAVPEKAEEAVKEVQPEEVQPEETAAPEEKTDESAPVTEEEPAAFSASGTCGDNLTWTLSDAGVLTISGTGPMTDVPSTNIVTPWSADHWNKITSVVVKSGVTTIGSFAFHNLRMVQKITFESPSKLTKIGDSAFNICMDLPSIEIPYGVTEIGNTAFSNCASLKEISIPGSITKFGSNMFQYCSSLESIEISEGTETLGSNMFKDLNTLKTVKLPSTLKTVQDNPFSGCRSITNLTVASGNPYFSAMDGYLFNKDKTGIVACPDIKESYSVPSTVAWIGNYAFKGCKLLKSIVIPYGVNSIGSYAFNDCSSLQEIDLPSGISVIRYETFANCSALKNVTIPDGVSSIETRAFWQCKSLESITIPDSVTGLGAGAFLECAALKSIVIPDGVTFIDSSTFAGCGSLESVTISADLTKLGKGAFKECNSLKELTFPGNAPEIDELAFEDFSATVYYPGDDPSWTADRLKDYGGSITWVPYTSRPVLTLSASRAGISIVRTAVTNAENYRIQRSTDGSVWTDIMTGTDIAFTDADVLMGTEYTYRAQAYVKGKWRKWSDAKTLLFNPFTDVPSSGRTLEYVSWAYNNGVVTGTSDTAFSPQADCTRLQFVMMLWKMNGSPETEGRNPFRDITGKKAAKAAAWAVQEGIVKSGKKFNPNDSISRVQIVMMLWKMSGSPVVSGNNPFTDVDGEKTTQAVLWAYNNGITKGTGRTAFSPDRPCTRLQLVTFLYKYTKLK